MRINGIKRIGAIFTAAVMLTVGGVGYADDSAQDDTAYEFYPIADTYETGTESSIPVSGVFGDSLMPQDGSAAIAEQSDAAVLVYSETAPEYGGNDKETITTDQDITKLIFDKDWYNGKVQVYSFDMFTPKAANFSINVLDGNATKEGVMISNKGWITPYESTWVPFNKRNSNWFDNYNGSGWSSAGKKADFKFDRWNKVTVVSDIENNVFYLYLNNALVDSINLKTLNNYGWTVGDASDGNGGLTIRTVDSWSAKRAGSLMLDNIKVGNLESFDGADTLANQLTDMNVMLDEDFQGDAYSIALENGAADKGQLAPNGGSAKILKQSNAAVVSFGDMNNRSREIRFGRTTAPDKWPATDTAVDNTPEIISFDINMFKSANLSLTIKQEWTAKYNIFISDKGYITHTQNIQNISIPISESIADIFAMTKDEAHSKYGCAADFEPYMWHNIKLIYTAGSKTASDNEKKMCYLYVDNQLVGELQLNWWGTFDKIDISNYTTSSKDEMMFAVDNLKIGTIRDEEFSVTDFGFVAADETTVDTLTNGKIYANTKIINAGKADKNITVSAMAYKDGALTDFKTKSASVKPSGVFVADKTQNTIAIDTDNADSVRLTLQDGDTGVPVIDDVYITNGSGIIGKNKFSGTVTANANVSVNVYAPGKSYEDLSSAADFRDVLIYKTQVKADEKGRYDVAFNIDYDNAVSGMYTVIAAADGYSHAEEILCVNSKNTEKVFNNELKPAIDSGRTNDVADVILNNYIDLYIDDTYLDNDIAKRAAELLIKYAKVNTLTAFNVGEITSKAVGVAAFEQEKLADIIGESDIFVLDNSELGGLYDKEFVARTVRDDITNRMKNQRFDSIGDFYDSLYDSFILAVVANPQEPNCVKTVLEKFGIKADSKGYAKVTGNNYKSVAELKKAIESVSNGGTSGSSTGGSSGGGGRVEVANKPTQTDEPTREPRKDKISFSDIDGVMWAKDAIVYLANKGIVNGKEDGKFYPTDNVTREEFTKMLTEAFEIRISNNILSFKDVKEDEWYSNSVCAAYSSGIVKGYGDDVFGIGENITREDMAVMLCRAAAYSGITLSKGETGDKFADDDKISDYATESVYAMKNAGIISGKGDNMFAPSDFATRAEAAKMIFGLIRD